MQRVKSLLREFFQPHAGLQAHGIGREDCETLVLVLQCRGLRVRGRHQYDVQLQCTLNYYFSKVAAAPLCKTMSESQQSAVGGAACCVSTALSKAAVQLEKLKKCVQRPAADTHLGPAGRRRITQEHSLHRRSVVPVGQRQHMAHRLLARQR